MNTFMLILLALIPAVLLGAAIFSARKTDPARRKRAIAINVLTFALALCATVGFGASDAFAANENDTATAASSTSEAADVNTEEDAHNSSLGIGLLAAALVTGLAGIGGGIAVAAGAPAAIAANSENPKTFGKSLIFVALGESIALYGLVISIMILNKLV
ncbi:MAG: ATP synthase subunit C [Faecalibacterium sp.]|jgi:V/A-type H+-transporting ATPase subunit K|nr:ATP synthase subunit C [Faecalibacterium sp.]